MELLAQISGNAALNLIVWIVILGVVFFVVNWFFGYIKLGDPFLTVARVVLALVVCVLLINALMGLGGHPFIRF